MILKNQNKNIWILGAGASISHNQTFPSIDRIFSTAKHFNIINDSTKTIKPEYAELDAYIQRHFNKKIMLKSESIDVEKVMTILQIDNENFRNSQSIELSRQVLALLRTLLIKCESYEDEESGDYRTFVKKFINEFTTVLTFNWDRALDNIIREKPLYQNFLQDISGTFVEGHLDGRSTAPYSRYAPEEGIYLKLHGSIDWVYCNNGNCRLKDRIYVVPNPLETYYCNECHERCQYLIIPPILHKQYNAYATMNRVWNRARKELEQAYDVYIWGYGLPPTDFYVYWLFTLIAHTFQNVSIINPATLIESTDEHGKKNYRANRVFINRYKEIFYRSNMKFYRDFSDFQEKKEISQYDIIP